MRYPSKQIHQIVRYEPTFKGRRYKDGAMLLNFEDTLGSTMTEVDRIEHILEIIIFQEHSLKAGFECFRKKGKCSVIISEQDK